VCERAAPADALSSKRVRVDITGGLRRYVRGECHPHFPDTRGCLKSQDTYSCSTIEDTLARRQRAETGFPAQARHTHIQAKGGAWGDESVSVTVRPGTARTMVNRQAGARRRAVTPAVCGKTRIRNIMQKPSPAGAGVRFSAVLYYSTCRAHRTAAADKGFRFVPDLVHTAGGHLAARTRST
jgi:hypothetical protein